MNIRFDSLSELKAKENQNGFLESISIVTRIGVYQYKNIDGSISNELRHPSEVFRADSLNTLKNLPVVLDHPPEMITPDNVSRYQVGYTGDEFYIDGNFVKLKIIVANRDAIEKVLNGYNQLSLGYYIDLVPENGVYDGVQYDAKHTNIIYNHLAIVEKARAGEMARINIDRADSISVLVNDSFKPKFKKGDSSMGLKTVAFKENVLRIDENDAPVFERLTADINAKLDSNEKKLAEMQAKLDSLTKEKEKLEEKLKEATSPERIDSAINEKIEVVEKAKKIIGDSFDYKGKSIFDIKKEVVKSDGVDVENKSKEYIEAYFDIVIEKNAKKQDSENINSQKEKIDKTDGKMFVDENGLIFDSEDIYRNEFMNKMLKLSKGE